MSIEAKPQVFYTKHQAGLTLMIDGVPAVIDRTNPNFDAIEADLKAGRYDKVMNLANPARAVKQAITESGSTKLELKNGEVFWNGPRGPEKVEGPLVERIITSIRDGVTAQAIRPLVALLNNISRNKRKDLREEIYQFLMSGKMPITADGCFLAYKKVGPKFMDIYSGKFDNSPGKLVAMPEEGVNTNRNVTCAAGLHFCSRDYLSHYSSVSNNKVVIVKVNPRFVFAIPTDYNFAKGRASEYYVVGEAMKNAHEDELFLQPFIFNENLKDAAPNIKFVGQDSAAKNGRTKPDSKQAAPINDSLKPSLKTMAEGYGLSKNGKAFVRVEDSKGPLKLENYAICTCTDSVYTSVITGKPVPTEHVRELSIQTKSVRSVLARAVARRRARG